MRAVPGFGNRLILAGVLVASPSPFFSLSDSTHRIFTKTWEKRCICDRGINHPSIVKITKRVPYCLFACSSIRPRIKQQTPMKMMHLATTRRCCYNYRSKKGGIFVIDWLRGGLHPLQRMTCLLLPCSIFPLFFTLTAYDFLLLSLPPPPHPPG